MDRRLSLLVALALLAVVAGLISCGSSNQSIGRVLTSIAVTPQTADAHSSSNGKVVFTATGTFSLPPYTGPLTFVAPYAGQFVVDNPNGTTIATVVSSGAGTVTVQCASGGSGSVAVTATASANNGSTLVVSGSGQLTCP
jgi:ABC-type glycerol-3-phosphate transport system substrate-binding protein